MSGCGRRCGEDEAAWRQTRPSAEGSGRQLLHMLLHYEADPIGCQACHEMQYGVACMYEYLSCARLWRVWPCGVAAVLRFSFVR